MEVGVTAPTEKSCYRYVETFAAVFTCAPNSSPPVVDIQLLQVFVTLRAGELATLYEVLLHIHVATLNVLDQCAFSDVKRLAVRAAVVNGNTCGTAFLAENDFVKQFPLKNADFVQFSQKRFGARRVSSYCFNCRITIAKLCIEDRLQFSDLTAQELAYQNLCVSLFVEFRSLCFTRREQHFQYCYGIWRLRELKLPPRLPLTNLPMLQNH